MSSSFNNKILLSISNKLRQPLSSIIESITLLGETKLSSMQTNLLDDLYNSSYKILSTTNNLIDIVNLSNNQLNLTKKNIEVKTCIEEIMTMVNQSIMKDITVKYKIKSNIPDHIKVDCDRIKQILLNLINNSINHMDDGFIMITIEIFEKDKNNSPYEHIEPESPKKNILFKVHDTGCGIKNKSYVESILNLKDIDKLDSSGFSLWISKELCKLMGGNIWFVSCPNEYTNFYFNVITD